MIGIVSLVLSYLCFINVIAVLALEICGSYCEYWWSWIIPFPAETYCILICVPRNVLYKPLFIIGAISIGIEVVYEIFKLFGVIQPRE